MKYQRVLLMASVVLLTLVLAPNGAGAQGPTGTEPRAPRTALGTAFTYQGQLKSGGSVVNGSCDLQFGLWDDASVGAQKGVTQTVTVNVTNGLFTTVLNSGGEFGASAFDGNARWLAMTVRCPSGGGSYTAFGSRQALTPAPYALYATNAGTATNATTATNFSGTLNGDVTGAQSSTSVIGLRGVVISTTLPSNGQVLQYNSTLNRWVPATVSGGGGGWSLMGNSGTNASTNFLGTTDNVTLTLRANNQVGWRLAPSGANTPNVIGGYSGNSVTSGVKGATIGGGGFPSYSHRVTDDYGTIGGGDNNQAGDGAGSVSDQTYATVGGGSSNRALSNHSTIGGGDSNTASNNYATVGGGMNNTASGNGAFVGGGGHDGTNLFGNQAAGNASTIGGGLGNSIPVAGTYATVGGGVNNTASGNGAFVGGGGTDGTYLFGNKAQANAATISGGISNTVTSGSDYATIGGGVNNTASGKGAFVGGGGYDGTSTSGNQAVGIASTIGGGFGNSIPSGGDFATVGGGSHNTASGWLATVGGGYYNTASANNATVGGGLLNTASDYAAVGGGSYNTASDFATVGGGSHNTASGYATVGGGKSNTASGKGAFVGGGGYDGTKTSGNQAVGIASTIGGGFGNRIPSGGDYATVGGGSDNTASDHATVGGGRINTASDYATVGGGYYNTASGEFATVPGGLIMSLLVAAVSPRVTILTMSD